jgi:hypothetical protein
VRKQRPLANRPRSRRQGRRENPVAMKNRLYLVCGVLLVAALGLLWWSPWEPPEPVYDGKPLSYWLITGAPAATRPPASLFSDSNAVPFLIEAIRRDSWFGATIYRKRLWPKLPATIQRCLPPPPAAANAGDIRCYAAAILKNMGPMAKPAIPALVRALKEDDDHNVRHRAVESLWDLRDTNGDSTVSAALVRALRQDEDPRVRYSAADSLGDSNGKRDKAAIGALTDALKDRQKDVRIASASALTRVGKGDKNVAAALAEVLKDKDVDARIHAALALWNLGELKRDTNVVIILSEALRDRYTLVRIEATNALLKIDPEAAAKAGVKRPSP